MAHELGLGVTAWSPLASGVLTGKYGRNDLEAGPGGPAAEGTRRDVAHGNGALTERSIGIAEVVKAIATEARASPAQIALAWLASRPSPPIPIIGARTIGQMNDNLGALELNLDADHLRRLDAVSEIDLGFPHDFLALEMTRAIMAGGVRIAPR